MIEALCYKASRGNRSYNVETPATDCKKKNRVYIFTVKLHALELKDYTK
ncbi:hypothetical protein [Methanobrevibacter sp.]